MDNTYLKHYAKGSESDNHSYLKREYINGKWVYYYDQPKEISQQTINNASNAAANKVKNDKNNTNSSQGAHVFTYNSNTGKTEYTGRQQTNNSNNFHGAIKKGKSIINNILSKLRATGKAAGKMIGDKISGDISYMKYKREMRKKHGKNWGK